MKAHSFKDAAIAWRANRCRRVISTGIPALDACLGGGLPVRQITTIGAYTDFRKSELARQIARRAMANGYRVMLIDIELGEDRIFERFYVQEAGLPLECLINESFTNEIEERSASQAMEVLVSNNLFSIYAPGNMPPLSELLAQLSKDLLEGQQISADPVLVIFDSVQRLALGQRAQSIREGMIEFMGLLENFARNHNVAVIAISEGGRPTKGKARKMKMSDFAESRAIEYVSDVAIVISAVKEKRPENEAVFELDIEKNRPSGFKGTVPGALVFTKPCWSMFVETPEQREKAASADQRVREFLSKNPEATADEIAKQLHIRRKTAGEIVRQIRARKASKSV